MLPVVVCSVLIASGTETPMHKFATIAEGDTADLRFVTVAATKKADSVYKPTTFTLEDIDLILTQQAPLSFMLGVSKQQQEVGAWYFPGTSDKRALIIAGVHGSELSAVELANAIMKDLFNGEKPYYSTIIIPTLFPDNANAAMLKPTAINSVANIGRYSFSGAVDPNRQMPSPGKPFYEKDPTDHVGREIEQENQLLLKLIQEFKPHRIANLHAIRNSNYGGVYADPRTDHEGIALGFETDSALAISIARHISRHGGNVAGNRLKLKPTALYYKDPTPVAAGKFQPRNMTGSALKANRGSGVSLGTWASTAVVHENDSTLSRDAMRILTIEYPGCRRPSDYVRPQEKRFHEKQMEAYASAIRKYFLGNYYAEGSN